ncbi:hypothetical protein NN561_014194 [Cricetulus griseus]
MPSHPNSRRSHREPGDGGRTKARAAHSPARRRPARAGSGSRGRRCKPQASGSAAGETGASGAGRVASAEVATLPAGRQRAAGGQERTELENGSAALWNGKAPGEQLPRAYLHVICMELQEWT